MAQAQGVAHLVHRHVLEIVQHELLHVGAGRIEFTAGLQHVQRVAHLLSGMVTVQTGVTMHVAGRCGTGQQTFPHGIGRLQQAAPVGGEALAQHLRSGGSQAARGQALEADVGVQDLARARVHVAGPDGTKARLRVGHPAHGGHAQVQGVEVGIVSLLLDDDGVLEADLLEGLVPLQDAFGDGAAVRHRDGLVQPVGDGLDRLRQRRCRILLLQAPAVGKALLGGARLIAGEVLHVGGEVTHARVGPACCHGHLGQLAQRVVQAKEHAAGIGQPGRRGGHRGTWRCRSRCREAQAGRGVVAGHLEHHQIGLGADPIDARVAGVKAVALAETPAQAHAQAEHVVDEQAIGFHQHRLALRVRGAGHRRAGQQAGREGGRHRPRLRRARLGDELAVHRQQADLVVHSLELDDLGTAVAAPAAGHRAAEQSHLANAAGNLGREIERFVKVFWLELKPDLVVLLPNGEQAVGLPGVLDDGGEGLGGTGG